MVVAAAGNLEHPAVVRAVRGSALAGGQPAQPVPHRDPALRVPIRKPRSVVRGKDSEQAHVVLGCPAFGRLDERRFALGVLNNSLGGGMSSRLFQEIREKRGLAYSVYSYTSHYADTGVFAVYAGCAPGKVAEVLDLTRSALAEVAAYGLTDDEVARGRGMTRGSLVLGLEDTGSRMSRLAKGDLLYDEPLRLEQVLAKVEAVTPEQVREVAAEVLARPMSLAAVGPVDDLPEP
jgi:predicted Zn-dependent peptidase